MTEDLEMTAEDQSYTDLLAAYGEQSKSDPGPNPYQVDANPMPGHSTGTIQILGILGRQALVAPHIF